MQSMGLGITLEGAIPILQNGKQIKITNNMFLSCDSNPVRINNDSGEIMNFFFNTNEQDVEYTNLYIPSLI